MTSEVPSPFASGNLLSIKFESTRAKGIAKNKNFESNEKVISSQKIVRLSKAITNTPTVNPMKNELKLKKSEAV